LPVKATKSFFLVDDDDLLEFEEEFENEEEDILVPFDVERTSTPHDPIPTFQPTLSDLSNSITEKDSPDKLLEEFHRLKSSLQQTLEMIGKKQTLMEIVEVPKLDPLPQEMEAEVFDNGETFTVSAQELRTKSEDYVQSTLSPQPYVTAFSSDKSYANTRDIPDSYTSSSIEMPYITVTSSSYSYTNLLPSKIGYVEVEEGEVSYTTTSTVPEQTIRVNRPYCYAY